MDILDKEFDTTSVLNKYEDEIDVSENKLENKTFQVLHVISHFEYRLLGFMWKANAEKFYYTGNCLVGDETLQKIMLLLQPFSREILLISNKTKFDWAKQMLRTRMELINLLTKATDVDIKNFKEIWRSFSNVLINIGHIIVGENSKEVIEKYFGLVNEDKQYNDRPIGKDNENVI